MNKQKWIARALEMGVDGLEIYEGQSAERSVAWFDGQMDSFVTSDVKGTALRAVVNGKAATLVLESVDDDKIDETISLLIAQAGLVGIVTQTGPDWAIVRSIVDDNSNVSAMVSNTSDTCIISGDLELIDKGSLNLVKLRDDDNHVHVGDKVVTSNISEKFLPGILIG